MINKVFLWVLAYVIYTSLAFSAGVSSINNILKNAEVFSIADNGKIIYDKLRWSKSSDVENVVFKAYKKKGHSGNTIYFTLDNNRITHITQITDQLPGDQNHQDYVFSAEIKAKGIESVTKCYHGESSRKRPKNILANCTTATRKVCEFMKKKTEAKDYTDMLAKVGMCKELTGMAWGGASQPVTQNVILAETVNLNKIKKIIGFYTFKKVKGVEVRSPMSQALFTKSKSNIAEFGRRLNLLARLCANIQFAIEEEDLRIKFQAKPSATKNL